MTAHHIESGAPLTVLAAYRADLARRRGGTSLGSHDATWIAVGTMMSHADGHSTENRERLLDEARRVLRDALGDSVWTRRPVLDADEPLNEDEISPRMRHLCEQIEDAGALTLAEAMLATYVRADLKISPLERGRLDALRGRLAWKRGDHVMAEGLYRSVERAARRQSSPELRVRAYIGYAVLARLRGNLPVSRTYAGRAVRLGTAHGLKRLAALGHQTLMYAAVSAGDMNRALQHGWAAYEDVRGDAAAEAAGFTDIAQLFLDCGHVELAASGFALALRRHPLPERVLLPALGGAAIAAARQGDLTGVTRIAGSVLDHADDGGLPYQSTASRLDVAQAFCYLNAHDAAEPFRRAAEDVATSHQYHELVYRAENLRVTAPLPTPPVRLTAKTIRIGAAVRELAGTHA